MNKYKFLISILILSLFLIPNVSATINPIYNCTDSYLTTNISGIIDGDWTEIFWNNVSCPFGCAENGLECNSPQNVDMASVSLSSIIFMVLAIVFFLMSNQVKGDFWPMKYLFLFIGFVYMLLAVALIGGMFIFGQNNISNLVWMGWYVLSTTFIFILLVTGLKEGKDYIQRLKIKKGEV